MSFVEFQCPVSNNRNDDEDAFVKLRTLARRWWWWWWNATVIMMMTTVIMTVENDDGDEGDGEVVTGAWNEKGSVLFGFVLL